jgi:type II secretory pathway pseudopilin PulG
MFSSPQDGQHRQSARSADSEAGYILVAVLFLVAIILITLAVAAPRIAQSIQRDRELELLHRGEQYKRAVKLYYKKFQAYPSSIDQLVNTNQIRFLRKRYTDPMTGKDDWKIIHQGEQHVRVMGLFGQPLATSAGASAAGTSIAGMGAGGLANGTTAAPGTSAPSSGALGASGSTTGSTGAAGGSTQDGSAFGQSGFGGTTGTSGPGSGGLGSSGLGGGTGGNTNPTFGGGPIVGVKIPNTKASIKEYKLQKHYNEWEFVYDPIEEQMQGGGAMFGGAGANLNGVGNGTANPTSPTSGFGGTGFGNSGTGIGGTNPSPMPTPSPTPTPQQ